MADTNTTDAAANAFAESLAAAAALEPGASTDASTDLAEADEAGADGQSDDDASDEAGDESDDADADESDGDEDDEGEDSEEPEAKSLSSIKEKFLAGDKVGALKALGLDPKILDLNDAKFRTMRQGIKAADEKLAAATEKETKATNDLAEVQRMYKKGQEELGPVLALRRMLAKGDYLSAKDMLEALAPPGTTYQQIAEGIALAAKGMSPSEQLYRRRLRELDEKEQREKAEKEKPPEKPAPTADSKNLEGAKKALASTPLADIPGAAEALVRIAAEHWDPKGGLKKPRAELIKLVAKDPVISQLLELKQLKAKKGKAPEPPTTSPRDRKGRFQERSRERKSNLSPEQLREQQREREFRDSVAQAAAMERQERRKAGAGKGRR